MTPKGPPNRGSNSDWGHSLTVDDALQGLRINFELIIYKQNKNLKINTSSFCDHSCYYIKCWFGCRDCFMKVFLLLNQSFNVRGLDTTNIKWALCISLQVKNTIKISFSNILLQQLNYQHSPYEIYTICNKHQMGKHFYPYLTSIYLTHGERKKTGFALLCIQTYFFQR